MENVAGTAMSVFTATFTKDHHDALMRDPEAVPRFLMTGKGTAMLLNRLSLFFDFRGPSITLDTACSTSLAAVHLACQSLRTGESESSIVTGANIMLNPEMF